MAGTDARSEERVGAQVRARLRASGPDSDAQILEASSRGLRLTAQNPPGRGEIVEVIVGNQELVGQVRWTMGSRFGVKLGDRINVNSLVSGRGGPVRIDPAPVGEAIREDAAEEPGVAYNLVFYAAAVIASLGFLVTAVQRTIG